MRQADPNAIINPHFELLDYGTGLVNSTAFVATRTKLERAGTAGAVTAQPGTTPSAATLAKFLRSRPCIDMVVTASSYVPGVTTVKLRQRVPLADRFGKSRVRLVVLAFGPAGGSFEIALSSTVVSFQRRYRTVQTYGSSPGGTPTWTRGVLDEDISDLPTESLTAEFFANPADMDATYQVAFAHLEFLGDRDEPSPWRYSPPWVERLRAKPYLWVCPKGHRIVAISATAAVVQPWFESPMFATPTVKNGVGVGSVVFRGTQSGLVLSTSTAAGPGQDAVPNISDSHARVAMTGFSGLTAKDEGFLGTAAPFMLEAEIA